MITSAALTNSSVFRAEPLDIITVAKRCVDIAQECSGERREWQLLLNTMLRKNHAISRTC
jgi:hypothetical protein